MGRVKNGFETLQHLVQQQSIPEFAESNQAGLGATAKSVNAISETVASNLGNLGATAIAARATALGLNNQRQEQEKQQEQEPSTQTKNGVSMLGFAPGQETQGFGQQQNPQQFTLQVPTGPGFVPPPVFENTHLPMAQMPFGGVIAQ